MAREAGVSPSTASRVLRGFTKVLPETRDRIFAAAEKLGYRPNLMARALRTGERRTVAFVAGSDYLLQPVCTEAIAALNRALVPEGLSVVVAVVEDGQDLADVIEQLPGWCGTLVVQGSLARDPAALAARGAKVVLADWFARDEDLAAGVGSAGFDQREATRQAVTHLVSIGHRNIAYLGGPAGIPEYDLRESGFRAGMDDASLPVRTEWLFHCNLAEAGESAGTAFDSAVTTGRSRLTAVVCATDALALGVVDAVRRNKLLVPDDVSVVGYGNTMSSRLSRPRLTTIEHRGHELGLALAQIVLARHEAGAAPRRVTVPAHVVLGDTTAPRASHMIASAAADADSCDGRTIPDGVYELQALCSGQMLDVPNAARMPGGQLWQWVRNGTGAQLWHVAHVCDGLYRVRNVGSWLYLDADPTKPDFCPAIVNPRNDANPEFQLWGFEPVDASNQVYRIVNKAKTQVLDVAYGAHISNELVMVFPWNSGINQQWRVLPVPILPGEYEIVALHSSYAMDVPNQSRAPGVVPCQAHRTRSLGQRWRLIHRGGACYVIQSKLSNLNLQASKPPRPSVMLCQEDPDAAEAQLWHIELADAAQRSYRFTNEALGAVLEIHAGQQAENAPVRAAEWCAAAHQQWLLYSGDDDE